MWTCCNCGNKFSASEMDLDERMCFDCLDSEDSLDVIKKEVKKVTEKIGGEDD